MKNLSQQRHPSTSLRTGSDTEKSTDEKIRRKMRAGNLDASGIRFGIVVSRFNEFITDRLLRSAYDALLRSGAKEKDIEIVRVPGSFEIPSAARTLAETKKCDVIICLGCLLRGDTAHYDVIVNEVARGIGQSAQETGVPHAFGVLTCDTLEQAIDRAGLKMGNKGSEAALAAVEMASLKKAITRKKARSSQQSAALTNKAVSNQPSAISQSMARKASSRQASAFSKSTRQNRSAGSKKRKSKS